MARNEDKRPEEGDEILAILAESIESNSKKDEILPEDAAWVDSCLISDPQVSDNSWDAVREALLESLITRDVHDDEEPSEEVSAMEIAGADEEASSGVCVEAEETEEECVLIAKADGDEDGEDNGENLLGSREEIESKDNIFKVWDLGVPEEEEDENELIKQLRKALAESKFKRPQQEPADVDELVAGLGDLSLEPPSAQSEGWL